MARDRSCRRCCSEVRACAGVALVNLEMILMQNCVMALQLWSLEAKLSQLGKRTHQRQVFSSVVGSLDGQDG